jgi:hypothetical protein
MLPMDEDAVRCECACARGLNGDGTRARTRLSPHPVRVPTWRAPAFARAGLLEVARKHAWAVECAPSHVAGCTEYSHMAGGHLLQIVQRLVDELGLIQPHPLDFRAGNALLAFGRYSTLPKGTQGYSRVLKRLGVLSDSRGRSFRQLLQAGRTEPAKSTRCSVDVRTSSSPLV